MYPDSTTVKYDDYIKRQKTKKRNVLFLQLAILIAFFVLWEVSARTGLSDPFLTSSPSRIFTQLVHLIKTNSLFIHVAVTTIETLIGFVLGTVLGTVIAALLWYFPTLNAVSEPYLIVLNALPKVALGPVIIVWAGANYGAIIFMTLLISVIVTIISAYGAFSATEPEKLTLMQTLNATRRQMFFKTVLPSSMPALFNTMKINVGMSWVGVIMGEFLVSKAGLGYLIIYGSNVFNLSLVMTGVVILAIIAALMYFCVALLEKKVSARMG